MVKKTKKKKKAHYIDNKEFEQIIKDYLVDEDTHEARLCELLDLLITNILHSFKFSVDFDDAKQECFLISFKTLKKFKPENGSAFNYFTTVIVNNLKLIYTKEKKYREKLAKLKERLEANDPSRQS